MGNKNLIITIEREYGSGGRIVGRKLAEELAEHGDCHHDHFTNTFPVTNWRSGIEHAVKIGLGSADYDLVTLK